MLVTTVVVPFTSVEPEVREALLEFHPRYVDVSDSDWGYWRLLCDLWAGRQTFVVVEHDVVPPLGAVRALLDCPRDWCGHAYPMGAIAGTALGCVKLGAGLMERTPNAVSRILPQHRSWRALDSMVLGTLRNNGEEEHVHEGLARHLRYERTIVRVGRRNKVTTRLFYVGDGRYLNGVPRADFDTDDPTQIALCVGSGLYVTEEQEPTPAEKSKPLPTWRTEPEPVEPVVGLAAPFTPEPAERAD